MNEELPKDPSPSHYTPSPQVPVELMPRLALILQVLSGQKTVSEAAREARLSRNHFQTLMHRTVAAMVHTLTPKEPGPHPKPPVLGELERKLKRVERENVRLKRRVEATDELFQVAAELLRGQRRPGQRSRKARKKDSSAEPADSEPEPHARILCAVDRMHELGLTLVRAAHLAGIDASTVRRWRAHFSCAVRSHPCASAASLARAEARVRALHGLIGAAALSHGIGGLTRREAARIKARTLTIMERERLGSLRHVQLGAAGVMRGIDAMYFATPEGPRYALIAADAAVPYRTSFALSDHYDTHLVTELLERDIARHGAPLVIRSDRAKAHDAPEVQAILKHHHIRMLHGPPRYPRFYGQLERQNREHRAWLAAIGNPHSESMQQLLERMLYCLNSLWPRRTLGWRTAADIWNARESISIDTRCKFEKEAHDRTQRLACSLNPRGAPADLAERLAIEQTLTNMGYLHQQIAR